jgi:histidine triad (HIT) family protein
MACLFCDIAEGKIPANTLIETDRVIAFKDISPQAPTHILVVPKRHVENVLELTDQDPTLSHHLFEVIKSVVETEKLTNSGFRVITNTGADGGQTVPHLHFHILGGRPLSWPPG